MKILAVDDDIDILNILDLKCKFLGHETRIAGSVEAAVSCLQEEPTNLLLLDYNLVDGVGTDVIVKAPADQARFTILFTGYYDRALCDAAVFEKINFIIDKPNWEALFMLVKMIADIVKNRSTDN